MVNKALDPSNHVKDPQPRDLLIQVVTVFGLLYRTGWQKSYPGEKFPNLAAVMEKLPKRYTPVAVQDCLLSDDFVNIANQRGIPYWRSKDAQRGLTSQMVYCAEIMLDYTKTWTKAERLSRAGVTAAQYSNWMRFKPFADMIKAGAKGQLAEHYNDINRALVHAAESGDVPAIKFAFEMMGEYDPNSKALLDVRAVLSQVIEIIQRHVTDPGTLGALAGDFQLLAGRIGISEAPVAAPQAVINGEVV